MKSFRKFWPYIKPYTGSFIIFFALSLFSLLFSLVSLTMAIPFLQILFNQVEPPSQQPEISLNHINSLLDYVYYIINVNIGSWDKTVVLSMICVMVVVLFLLKNFTTYISLHLLAPMRVGVIYDLRKKLFKKIQDLPLSYFSEKRKGDLITRMSADVVEVEWSIMNSIVSLIRDPIAMLAYLGYMFFLSYQLTLFVLILLPVSALLIGGISRSLKKASSRSQNVLSGMISIIEEALTGNRIIKAFNARTHVEHIFDTENKKYAHHGKSIFRKRSLSSPLSEFMGSIIVAAVMFFGGSIVLNEQLDAAVFITYIALFSQVINPAKAVAATYYNFQKGIASIERIEEILHAPAGMDEKPSGEKINGFSHQLELKGVGFRYGAVPVLEDIHLEIPKGKIVALVGPSGAGKSTLADLVCRFYDPVSGDILIDGKPLRSLDIISYRHLLGIVPQVPILFHDTIRHNIAFGESSIDEKAVVEAAKLANAHEFIMGFEHRYDTQVGDLGVKLSGGQRQRISIARALYRNPEILVLDEATSSLDTESEKLVQEAINSLVKGRTVLVIAHRLSTIKEADLIYVMNEGRIVESGTHPELVKANGLYSRLFEMNASVNS